MFPSVYISCSCAEAAPLLTAASSGLTASCTGPPSSLMLLFLYFRNGFKRFISAESIFHGCRSLFVSAPLLLANPSPPPTLSLFCISSPITSFAFISSFLPDNLRLYIAKMWDLRPKLCLGVKFYRYFFFLSRFFFLKSSFGFTAKLKEDRDFPASSETVV